LGGLMSWAGLITSAYDQLSGPGASQHICNTGIVSGGLATCSATENNNNTIYAQGTASVGSVSAYVLGRVTSRGFSGAAVASATFTETMTIFGGTGTGVLAITEAILNYGTGSLDYGFSDPHAYLQTFDQTFTFGTPFTFALSATSAGTFLGSYADAGTLLVSKTITSMSVLGGPSGLTYADGSGASYTIDAAHVSAAPEPAAWGLGLIGLGLLWIGSRRAKVRVPAEVDESK
jgi:MYXO-CTERM domain-containing protein